MRDPDREFDNTSLHGNVYGYTVHRDYASHFFRWGWVSRKFIDPNKKVLEIGCGVDTPLARVLTFKLANGVPKHYVGVDINKLNNINRKWATFIGGFDFSRRWKEIEKWRDRFDVIVCLEVVEHMRMPAMRRLLKGARALLAPGGKFLLSTPVFNGKMALNHINEMDIPTLQKEVEKAGFTVVKRYGTFMSDGDRKKACTAEENALVDRLKEYYSTDVLACFLAPLYPDASRNNIWILSGSSDLSEKDGLADLM